MGTVPLDSLVWTLWGQTPQLQGYGLLTKNCHRFCQYCVTGKVDNGITDFTFSNLEGVLRRELGMDCWRVWDGCWRGGSGALGERARPAVDCPHIGGVACFCALYVRKISLAEGAEIAEAGDLIGKVF